MVSCKFRDEFQNINTVETIEEIITVPVPEPGEKATYIAQRFGAARQSQPPHIAQMLIIIAENRFARIVRMLYGYRWNYPLIPKIFPKVAHCSGPQETLMGQPLIDKTLHQAFIDFFSAFDTDCPRVIVELTHDPQNPSAIPPVG
jgi:hypothetical protein